jgi:ATP-dependent helicase/nuclease subunit A
MEFIACAFHRQKGFSEIFFDITQTNHENDLFRIQHIYPETLIKENIEPDTETSYSHNDETVKQILRRFKKTYAFDNESIPAKIAVTEITKPKNIYALDSVKLSSSKNKMTAAEKGTVIHRFMQMCDFKAAALSVTDEIERLSELGYFCDREKSALDVFTLNGFFSSTLYREIISKALKIYREIEIYTKISDIPLDESFKIEYNIRNETFIQGIADCVVKTETGLVLIDYKTNKNFDGDKAAFCEHLRQVYTPQLTVYAAAVKKIFGQKVQKVYLYSFETMTVIDISDYV